MTGKWIPAAAGTVATAAAAVIIAACGSNGPAPTRQPTQQAPSGGAGPFTAAITECAVADNLGTPTVRATVLVANTSNDTTGAPDVQVEFTAGTTVLGQNYGEPAGSLAPGQTETVQVWGVGSDGNPLPTAGTTCQPGTYQVVGADGTAGGPYTW